MAQVAWRPTHCSDLTRDPYTFNIKILKIIQLHEDQEIQRVTAPILLHNAYLRHKFSISTTHAQRDLLLQTCVSEHRTNTAALCAEYTTNYQVHKTQQKPPNLLTQAGK